MALANVYTSLFQSNHGLKSPSKRHVTSPHQANEETLTRRRCTRHTSGQATVELALALPILLAVAVFAFNAVQYLIDCTTFDCAFHDAVRIYAISPDNADGTKQINAKITIYIKEQFDNKTITVKISASSKALGLTTYTAKMNYRPTLFGQKLANDFFGIAFFTLKHTDTYTVSAYHASIVS